eukprot:258740-Amorphochlora_amoeboformis.AAC.1
MAVLVLLVASAALTPASADDQKATQDSPPEMFGPEHCEILSKIPVYDDVLFHEILDVALKLHGGQNGVSSFLETSANAIHQARQQHHRRRRKSRHHQGKLSRDRSAANSSDAHSLAEVSSRSHRSRLHRPNHKAVTPIENASGESSRFIRGKKRKKTRSRESQLMAATTALATRFLSQVTDEQLMEVLPFMAVLDVDGDGYFSAKDLARALQNMEVESMKRCYIRETLLHIHATICDSNKMIPGATMMFNR